MVITEAEALFNQRNGCKHTMVGFGAIEFATIFYTLANFVSALW